MKKLSIYAIALLAFASCNSPEGDKAETTDKQAVASAEGTSYSVDTTTTITWTGTKPGGSHVGTLKISEGSVMVKDNALTGGSFTINIASLTNKDLSVEDGKEKLVGHLKSPDFFDVAKYPTAKFEITAVENYTSDSTNTAGKDATHMVRGNLTLKDSTKNISFPARITVDANTLSAKANFNIDRTMWGMNYKGPNNPQDWFISKEVNLQLDLSATKK
jgi:polyisoprenoid-binding protein YceI